MHKITLLCVGSLKSTWIEKGCSDFIDRVSHTCDLAITELPASKQKDPVKQAEEESEKILSALSKMKGSVWVLDEHGDRLTSQKFADDISSLRDRGDPLTLVIGGAYGLSANVLSKGDRKVRLSDMTFTHEMARLVLLEQLYRAEEIIRGSGYHH